jgi:hypothetical protein
MRAHTHALSLAALATLGPVAACHTYIDVLPCVDDAAACSLGPGGAGGVGGSTPTDAGCPAGLTRTPPGDLGCACVDPAGVCVCGSLTDGQCVPQPDGG